MGSGSLMRQWRRLVLLVLVKVKHLLDLVANALARSLAVSSVLLLVDVASTTTLGRCQLRSGSR